MQQPGRLLEGKYEILGKIREGGMGTIYRVRHRLLDEIRVVKVLKPETLANEELRRRFLEEARTATRLKHPNIGTIHDFALDEEGKAYLVMEYIEGINLAELLKKQGPPRLALSLEIAHQTLGALAYLHRKNIVHRDIAPDNLMLTHDEDGGPRVKLIDLGIAKTLDRPGEMTSTGVFLGKLKYASPEQFGSLPQGQTLDGRSDLYALGVVLYELFTGVHPFPEESPSGLLRAHLFDAPTPFERSDREGRLPPEARAAVIKALQKRREDRFASAEDFDREIVRLQQTYSRPDDLEDTARIISKLRSVPSPGSEPTVTPSAQDLLDRQFAAGATPQPSRATHLASMDEEKTEILAARPPSRAAAESETQPLQAAPARRSSLAAAVIAVAVLAGGALLLFSGILRRSAPQAPQAEPTAAAKSAGGAPPAPAPTIAAAPTAVKEEPTAAPEEPTAARDLAVPPAPTAAQETPDRLRHRAVQARARAEAARQRAERAGASRLAPALYDLGKSAEQDARSLLSRGEFAGALASFEASRTSFDKAREWAKTHPLPEPTPPERIAAAQEAPPRPQPTAAVLAPTAAPAPTRAPTPAPVPTRAPIAAPAEAQRGRERTTDEERIREAVRLYQKAQSTLDSDLYARVYPGVDKARVRAAFDELRSQTLELEIQKIEVAPGGATAVVRGLEKRVAVPRVGNEQHLSGIRVIHLEKRGDAWVITKLGS